MVLDGQLGGQGFLLCCFPTRGRTEDLRAGEDEPPVNEIETKGWWQIVETEMSQGSEDQRAHLDLKKVSKF